MAQLKSTIIQGDLGISGNIVASKIIKSGGTADKILLANGDLLSVPTAGLGTVTSVGISSNLTVSGSPITTSGTITITHPTKTATTADIYKVGMDGLGHVVLGTKITPADLGLSTVYKYKGTKTWAELLALTSAEIGDVYSITNADPDGNTNADWACHVAVTAACTAENYVDYWQSLGGKVDLSAYVTGSGTANYIPKFTAANTVGNSSISQSSTTNDITINGKLVVKASGSAGNSYNEGIRILPASNGWSEIFLSPNDNISGQATGWVVGRRGASGSVSGAEGDFTIEYNGSSGTGLTLYANGNRPRWNNNELAYNSDISDKTIILTAGNGLTDGGSFTLNQTSDETITFNVGAGEGITVNADSVAHSVPTGASAASYGPSDGGTQTAKGTLDIIVPQITTDKFGHITSVTNKTFKVTDTDSTNFMGLYSAVHDADLDLNNLISAGSHRINSITGSKNLPTFASGSTLAYGQLLVVRGSGDTIAQLAFPYGASEIAFRTGNPVGNTSGVWKDWKQVATQDWVESLGYTGAPDLSNYVTLNGVQTITGNKTFTGNVVTSNNKFEIKATGNTDDSWIKLTNASDDGYYAFGIRRPYNTYGLQLKIKAAGKTESEAEYYDIWNANNDGSGSGLDADKLDGQEGTYYLDYNNFTNKPTIPTVNNGTLTIQKNGTNVATFTANQSSNATANITVPDPVDYYWANVKVSSTSSTATIPSVQKIGITGSATATANAAVTLEYDTGLKALKFVFA